MSIATLLGTAFFCPQAIATGDISQWIGVMLAGLNVWFLSRIGTSANEISQQAQKRIDKHDELQEEFILTEIHGEISTNAIYCSQLLTDVQQDTFQSLYFMPEQEVRREFLNRIFQLQQNFMRTSRNLDRMHVLSKPIAHAVARVFSEVGQIEHVARAMAEHKVSGQLFLLEEAIDIYRKSLTCITNDLSLIGRATSDAVGRTSDDGDLAHIADVIERARSKGRIDGADYA